MAVLMLTSIAIIAVTAFLYKQYSKRKDSKQLQIPDWKKDVVYLFQFPVSQKVRSISPFCIKLESWLRLTGIPYENIYTSKPSRKGQTPYIEFNGEQIPDSNLSIDFLKDHFKDTIPKVIEEDAILNDEQRSLSHLTKQTLENHTSIIGFYWRYGLNMEEFYRKMIEPAGDAYPSIAKYFFRKFLPFIIRLRAHLQGVSRHSPDEMAGFSFQDIAAISKILGSKPFFFGDKMTAIDCTIFGHLAQFLFIPMDFPQKKFITEDCPNLLAYMDRVKTKLWPDWEQECKIECMDGKLGR